MDSARVAEPPEDGEAEDGEDQEAEPRVPLLERPLIVEEKREWRPTITHTRHNYALNPQGNSGARRTTGYVPRCGH